MDGKNVQHVNGNRLDEKVLSVFVDNKNINDITGLSIRIQSDYFKNLHLTPQQKGNFTLNR